MKDIDAIATLKSLASSEVASSSSRFFKTGPGQYGEGDHFIGVRVPMLRKLARDFRTMPLTEIEILLHSPIHEERMLALLVLVLSVAKCSDGHRKTVCDFCLNNTRLINNLDLVDTIAQACVSDRRDSSAILPFWNALLSLGLFLIVRSNILADHRSTIAI